MDEIHQAVLPLLTSEYDRFMRKRCEFQSIDPVQQVSFILGGFNAADDDNPFQLYLLWTKRKMPLLDSDEIDTALSVSRIIKLE